MWREAGALLLDAVFLIDSVHFNASLYNQTLSDACVCAPTLLSIQSDTPTGAEVRQQYFPDHTEIRLFQLVHITRVQATVAATTGPPDDGSRLVAAVKARCLASALPPMVVTARAASEPQGAGEGLQALLASLPPAVAPVAVGLWLLTLLVCGAYVCCCRRAPAARGNHGAKAMVPDLPSPPIAHRQPATPATAPATAALLPSKPIDLLPSAANKTPPFLSTSAPSAPSLHLLLMSPRMRLPPGLETAADRRDPCEAPTCLRGPAAVRLASWPEAPGD